MRTELARVGARVVDSYPFSLGGTAVQAKALKAAAIDCLVGYLGVINGARLRHILDAELAFMPVSSLGTQNDQEQTRIRRARALLRRQPPASAMTPPNKLTEVFYGVNRGLRPHNARKSRLIVAAA